MAVVAGTRYSYTDTANIAINMSDTLDMMSPSDVPFLQKVGKNSLSFPCTSTKHEWLEAALRSLDGAVANDTSLNNTTDPVTFNVASGQGVLLRAGDILLVESELVRVTAVATDAITVVRAHGGTTAAAHAANTAWSIIGNVNVQDAGVGASRTTTKSGLYNYTQIFEDALVVTTTEEAVKKYVEQNTMTAQLRDAMKVAWIQWERTLLHGRKVAPAAGVAGAMDGVLVRLTSNAYAKAGALLVEDHIRVAMRDIWEAGGGGQLDGWVNAFQKERIDTFLDGLRQTNRTDSTAGSIVRAYENEYGRVTWHLDRNMPADTVLLTDTPRIGFGPLSNNGVNHQLRAIPIPQTTGTKNTMQILGQYTSETRQEAAHAKITGLATS